MAKAREIPAPDGRTTFRAAGRAAVAVRAAEVFSHADRALDVQDVEGVHDMRVATRRLRAVLEVFAPAFDRREHRAVLRDVKRLADALGARRDPDVQLGEIEAMTADLPADRRAGVDLLLHRLREEQSAANAALEAELAQVRELDLEHRLRALAGEEAER